MSILVTRPSPSGAQLTRQLRDTGCSAWHFPLLDFVAGDELDKLPDLLRELRTDDLLFALSGQAVRYASAYLAQSNRTWPCYVQAFAPGQATARLLQRSSGLAVNYPCSREASEMLLQLSALRQVAGKCALILRGNGGRELLGETLRQRGAKVVFCECYQRRYLAFNGDKQANLWQQLGIDTLVVTSSEMLQQLFAQIPAVYHNWLFACRLVVVSERLANIAHQRGWQNVVIADNADNHALLRTLQSLCYGK